MEERDPSKYYIDVDMGNGIDNIVDDINSLKPAKMINDEPEEEPVIISDIIKKSKKKKKKKTLLSSLVPDDILEESEPDDDLLDSFEGLTTEIDEDNEDIIEEQKKGYTKLKKQNNEYKKEFAEELTLLYSLLDETNKFSKEVEKKYKSIESQKVRGVSKYTNDLAQIVLNAKQNKLSILKEITSVKKTVADLTNKAESKTNKIDNMDTRSPEIAASAYFKNILMHGRSDFIKRMTTEDEIPITNDNINDTINNDDDDSYNDDDMYYEAFENRLSNDNSGYRSDAGNKYIEYEHRGVVVYVKKCVDTGEWEFIAIDKYNEVVDDYPIPTKRNAGRMRFSDDGTYVTDEHGRMYKVIEYYLPDEND